jgi:NAD(P)-dependent dehydrogenase (short-subunit alcohol dehydrogenase family)
VRWSVEVTAVTVLSVQDLGGKVAVVTGGGGGIGRALGERFLAEGMRVVLADIDEPLLKTTLDELHDRLPDGESRVIGVVTDVASLESVESLREVTLSAFGAVHLVCNNAAIPSGSDGALWQHHVNDWRWAIDVNVFGVIHGINAFVPVLLEQGEGHVVNTSSSNGTFAPLSNSAVYATTKAAVTTITECLWGQLRSMNAPVQASLLLPSTRTPGALNTGIWRPGRNRPERYARPGQAPPEGRDALTPFVEQLHLHGQELTFAPIEEVADIAVEGILADRFWIYPPNDRSRATVDERAASMRDGLDPEYLIAPSPWNVPKEPK